MKLATPATLSGMLGQITYMINMIYTSNLEDTSKMAGLGLGHAVSQCLGIVIFLGLNS